MKVFRTILLFLLLGAIVNVAVAWACATWVPIVSGTSQRRGFLATPEFGEDSGFTMSRIVAFGSVRVVALHFGINQDDPPADFDDIFPSWSDLPDRLEAEVSRAVNRGGDLDGDRIGLSWHAYEDWRGFPFPCLHHQFLMDFGADEILPMETGTIGGIRLKTAKGKLFGVYRQRAIPYQPVWSMFVVNTLLYGGVLWLAIPGTKWLMRCHRRRSGRCMYCAYDLRHADHAACPECGHETSGVKTA